jgi:hypothetical protein
MNLRDRLEAAKVERRLKAGLPPEEPDVSPMDQPLGRPGAPGADSGSDTDYSIDLTEYAPVVDLRPPPSRDAPSFTGALPVAEGERCPNCSGRGLVDMEDVVGGVDHYSCSDCGLLYQVARN